MIEVIDKPATNDQGDLWTTKDCADYLRISHRQFQDRVMCLNGFPKAVRIPTPKGGKGHPRWYVHEVKNWVRAHKEAA